MKLLTVQEVANLLQVCPRTVLNLAKRGELSGKKLGRLWRFEEQFVTRLLEKQTDIKNTVYNNSNSSNNQTSLESIYIENPNTSTTRENLDRPLSMMFTKNTIRFSKSVSDKREVLETLATLSFRTGFFGNYQSLVDSLIEREEMFPTAFEGEVAFPHPRRPLDVLNSSILAALVLENGIYFGAPDGLPTRLFIMICSPSDSGHVKLLSRLAHIFRDQRNIKKLLNTKNSDEFLLKFSEIEKNKNNMER